MCRAQLHLPVLLSILFLAAALLPMFRSGAVNEKDTPPADAPFLVVLGIAALAQSAQHDGGDVVHALAIADVGPPERDGAQHRRERAALDTGQQN